MKISLKLSSMILSYVFCDDYVKSALCVADDILLFTVPKVYEMYQVWKCAYALVCVRKSKNFDYSIKYNKFTVQALQRISKGTVEES